MSEVLRILYVDDDEDDHLFFREALNANYREPFELYSVYDGAEAIDTLLFADFPVPDVVVLDLNMPKLDGFAVLRAIRTSPVLVRVPVHVLSVSDTDDDRRRCIQLGCTSYHNKPVNFQQLNQVVREILSQQEVLH